MIDLPFDSRFYSVTTRISRVPRLIADLENALRQFEEREPSIYGAGFDAKKHVLKLPHPNDLLPTTAQAIVSDIVHNLRSALDNLVFDLAARNQGHEVDNTQFVIANTRGDFKKQRRSRLKGLTDDQVRIIEQVQPYNGHDWLRLLADLSNADKHKYLPLIDNTAPISLTVTDDRVFVRKVLPEWRLVGQYRPVDTLWILYNNVRSVAKTLCPDDAVSVLW